MSKTFEHKGYQGSMEFSIEDECLFGKILHINDHVLYEGNTIPELKEAFIEAVDSYLAFCEENEMPANKPFNGVLNVRLGPELHRAVAMDAARKGENINEYIKCAVDMRINNAAGTLEFNIHNHTHNHWGESKPIEVLNQRTGSLLPLKRKSA